MRLSSSPTAIQNITSLKQAASDGSFFSAREEERLNDVQEPVIEGCALKLTSSCFLKE
jgi:hypothetical protein